MKISVVVLSLICAVSAVPGVHAADGAPHEHEKQTVLGEHMEKMGRAFRKLGREVKDPAKNEDSLKEVAIMRTNAEAAVNLKPEKLADVPADQQTQFLADYQQSMKGLLADIDRLDAALKAGNNEQATALVKTLKNDMGKGHKQFRKPKHDMM